MAKLDVHTQADILAHLGLDRKRLARWQKKGDEPSVPHRPKSLDGTLIQEEKSMICNYYLQHPGDGYRRCTYMTSPVEGGAPREAPQGLRRPQGNNSSWKLEPRLGLDDGQLKLRALDVEDRAIFNKSDLLKRLHKLNDVIFSDLLLLLVFPVSR